MCFSPTASFVTAGLTGAIGIIALIRTTARREWPLAMMPVFFAIQQSIEGLLWLDLPSGAVATQLPLLFLLFAEVFWPVYVPVAIFLVEPQARRRQAIFVCLVVGMGVSAYLLWWLLSHFHGAAIIDDHIVYYTEARHSDGLGAAYLLATGLPAMLSSQRTLLVLGSIVLLGSVVAHFLYWEAFVSIWCFFAAAASVMILLHFERSRLGRLRVAGA